MRDISGCPEQPESGARRIIRETDAERLEKRADGALQGDACFRYQPLVAQIRAHMLIIVNRTIDTTSERDPEDVMKKHEDVG